jgi:Sulfotransferase family
MVERVFIVGVQRCGTTFIYHLLDEHPEIVMAKPVRPEPKVFLADSVTGNATAYDALVFPEDPPGMVRGEKSTSYLEHNEALCRIVDTFPEARFLVVLRDPVERAFSHYRFSVDNGIETRTLSQALVDDLIGRDIGYDQALSVSPYAYVRRGRYIEQLMRLERHVSTDNLHVIILEDLLAHLDAIRDVYDFLGVRVAFQPTLEGVPTNASNSTPYACPSLRAILRSHFAPFNAALERHLGRALMLWQ